MFCFVFFHTMPIPNSCFSVISEGKVFEVPRKGELQSVVQKLSSLEMLLIARGQRILFIKFMAVRISCGIFGVQLELSGFRVIKEVVCCCAHVIRQNKSSSEENLYSDIKKDNL